MRTPKKALNPTQAASQYFVSALDLGNCIEESRSGTADSRKRGSWWGMQLRNIIPEIAESTGRRGAFLIGVEKHR